MSPVPYRRWQSADSSLHHRLCNQQGRNRSTRQTTKSDHRLSYSVRSHTLWLCALLCALTPDFSFSGITAEALEPITTTLADVQAHLRTLITPSTILLGHSLESDLRALQLSHSQCIDTALIFHHPRGRPLKPGLAWLARKWLGRTIQDRGPGGHDPEEDARACVDLLKAKIKNGAYPAASEGRLKIDLDSRAGLRRVQGRLRTDPRAYCTLAIIYSPR